MPRLEDSLKIVINDAPEPEPEPSPEVSCNSGGSDMPDGKPFVDPVIDRLIDDDSLPLEDSLPLDEPEFVMKPPPKDEDLFEEPTKEVTNPLADEIYPMDPEFKTTGIYPMDPEFKKRTPTGKLRKPKGINSNGKKRKPMSEEHKQKLAVAREKALAKRRANAQKRKEEREKLNPPKEEPPSISLHGIPTEPVPEPTPVKQRDSITREDLEEISLKTIIAMETMRKKRKEEKKKKKAEEQYKGEVMNTIRKANPSWMETSGIYSSCY